MTTTPTSAATGGRLDVVGLIARKRDGQTLQRQEINQLIRGYVAGTVPDYQIAALLMAIVFRGLDAEETLWLTEAMVASGSTIDMSPLGRRIVDKHSTGGVGDKVSIALAPIIAACGVPFGKMSGRGLGHTGGTLDKLESIKGYRVELSQDQFLRQVREIGVAIVGQTADIVPADKKLYALRDVTATVESIPLIAASIMSKKLAAGADAIVLDIKIGSGAFIKTIEDARTLSDIMMSIGQGAGRDIKLLLTDMSTPLGNAVGNALEIAEVIELLQGGGPADLCELVITAAGMLLSLSDLDIDEEAGQDRAREVIASGAAFDRYQTWIRAQGGNPDAPLPSAPVQHTVLAPESGFVRGIDALEIGQAAFRLGAGRQTKNEAIDHAVGVQLFTHVGARIAAGEPLVTIHARTEEAAHEAAHAVEEATVIAPAAAKSASRERSVVIERRG